MASIVGQAIGSGIAEVVNAVGNQVNKKDELKANKENNELSSDTQIALAQNKVNEIEAASEDNYTRRARPTIMYICGIGFAYQYILQPFIVLTLKIFEKNIEAPMLDMTAIGTVLLGIAGLRTFDKFKK